MGRVFGDTSGVWLACGQHRVLRDIGGVGATQGGQIPEIGQLLGRRGDRPQMLEGRRIDACRDGGLNVQENSAQGGVP